MKFYPTDWRADPALKICSIGARGLWIEMLCIMHEAVPRGDLLIKGRSVEPEVLARLVGADLDTVNGYLKELEEMSVFSRRKSGVIYSRRMVSDEIRSQKASENGKTGGNPKLKNGYNKPGYVYLMGVRKDGAYKIGISVNPNNRLKKIRAKFPKDDIAVLDSWFVDDMGASEKEAHGLFDGKSDGEWFFLNAIDIGKLGEKMLSLKGPDIDPQKAKKPEARGQKLEEGDPLPKTKSDGEIPDLPAFLDRKYTGPLTSEQRREKWLLNIKNYMLRQNGGNVELVHNVIDAYDRGEQWAREQVDEIDRKMRAA
jgi:hypothetical protein